MELYLVALYYVQKSVISILAVNNVMFHVSCVIIIGFSAAFIEHDTGVFINVHIDSLVYIYEYLELLRHCSK